MDELTDAYGQPLAEVTPQIDQAQNIVQLVVWKDLLVALTAHNQIWILRGLNVTGNGSMDPRPPLAWVRVEAEVPPIDRAPKATPAHLAW